MEGARLSRAFSQEDLSAPELLPQATSVLEFRELSKVAGDDCAWCSEVRLRSCTSVHESVEVYTDCRAIKMNFSLPVIACEPLYVLLGPRVVETFKLDSGLHFRVVHEKRRTIEAESPLFRALLGQVLSPAGSMCGRFKTGRAQLASDGVRATEPSLKYGAHPFVPSFFRQYWLETNPRFVFLAAEAKELYPELFTSWRQDPMNFEVNGVYPVRELWDHAQNAWEDILTQATVSWTV